MNVSEVAGLVFAAMLSLMLLVACIVSAMKAVRDRRQILERNAARRRQRSSVENNSTAVHHHKRAESRNRAPDEGPTTSVDGVNSSPEKPTEDLTAAVRHVLFIPCHASRNADHSDLIGGLFNSDENHSVLRTVTDNTNDNSGGRSEDNRSCQRRVRPCCARELQSQPSASVGDFRSTLIGSRVITLLPARRREHGSSIRDISPSTDCLHSNRVRDISPSAGRKHRSSTVPDLPSASLEISCGPSGEVRHVVYSPRRHSYAEAVDSPA